MSSLIYNLKGVTNAEIGYETSKGFYFKSQEVLSPLQRQETFGWIKYKWNAWGHILGPCMALRHDGKRKGVESYTTH